MRKFIADNICLIGMYVSDGWEGSWRFHIAEKIHVLDDIVRGTYWGYEDETRTD